MRQYHGIPMANSTFMLACEDWIRLTWMAEQYGQPFHRERVRLSSGGVFDFDAVSADRRIAASISTSGAKTASGKHAAGKLFKIRSDMLFLMLADVSQRLMVLTERDMFDLCLKERGAGRVPSSIEFVHVPLPPDLCDRLAAARRGCSEEVAPSSTRERADDGSAVERQISERTPTNEALVNLARSHPPPAAWWRQDDDPFTPDPGK